MQHRTFGRLGWSVSEVGYGMWGLAGWSGSDDHESRQSLHYAIQNGCNFFDTAFAYGDGHSEKILGEMVRAYPENDLFLATKIPPKNRIWPSKSHFKLQDVFPADYIAEYTDRSLTNLGVEQIDLMQFHVWEDGWANDAEWQRAVTSLKEQGKVKSFGVSVNRWEPENVIRALETGLIDAVQVIYNIFDQAPEDRLFPVCEELGVAVIARVPFDEGTLTGKLTKDTRWPEGDWRNSYFVPENLEASVNRAEALRPLIPANMDMAEMALRFILTHPVVSTVIPGMRKLNHVRANLAAGDGQGLPPELIHALRSHRWNRIPTEWSQ